MPDFYDYYFLSIITNNGSEYTFERTENNKFIILFMIVGYSFLYINNHTVHIKIHAANNMRIVWCTQCAVV